MMSLTARNLTRAAELLERVDFTPATLRAHLNAERLCARRSPRRPR